MERALVLVDARLATLSEAVGDSPKTVVNLAHKDIGEEMVL